MYFNNNELIDKNDAIDENYSRKENNKSVAIFLIYFFITLIANVVLLVILKANPNLNNSVTEFYVSTGLNLAVAICLVILLKKALKNDLEQFRSQKLKSFGKIVSGMVMIYVTLLIVQNIILLINKEQLGSDNEEYISKLFTKDYLRLTILFFDLVVLAPFVEELVFRKAIFGLFGNVKNKIYPILASGFIFGIMHIMINPSEYLQSIPYIAMGLVLGFTYYRSNENIYINVGIHMLNNLISYVSYLLLVFGLISL